MPITAFLRVQDAGGPNGPETTVISVELPTATTPANALVAVRALATLIDPLTSGVIVGAGVTLEADLTGLSLDTVASVLADVQEKATFAFRTAAGKLKKISIPAFVETLFTGGGSGHDVDLTDTDVAAFVDAIETGIDLTLAGGTGTVAPVDTNDSDVVSLESALQTWGKTRAR